MQIYEELNKNKKTIHFIILCFIISTIIRFLIFPKIGLLQNDDYLYHLISKNIINGNGITSDGINPHLHFPPGYPFILGLENFIVKDPMLRRCIEWSILTGVLSLLTNVICNLIEIKRKYLASLICFFTPVYIYGTYTLSISSETWFSLIGALGLIFSINYINRKKVSSLFFANTLFSIAYLIRPEGILFYASTISIIFVEIIWTKTNFKFKNGWDSKKILNASLSFLLPFLTFVFPYLIYLRTNLGRWTISGKDKAHEFIAANVNENLIERLIGTIDLFFLTPFFLGLSFTFLTFLIVLKFFFNKKLKSPFLNEKKFKYFLVLFTPLIPNIYVCLKYFPGPRSIYGFIPCIIPLILLLFESTDSEKITKQNSLFYSKSNFLKIKDLLLISILLILVFNLILPKFLFASKDNWINNPKLYNKTIDLIKNDMIKNDLVFNKKPLVYSRNYNLAVDNNEFDFCYHEQEDNPIYIDDLKKIDCSNRKVDYLILGNLIHQSLVSAPSWELSAIEKEKVYYNNQECSQLTKLYINNKKIKVVGFKCKN